MDPFVRKLVECLLDEQKPISRNRHFHTLATPEGAVAVRISRRIRAIAKEITRCQAVGALLSIRSHENGGYEVLIVHDKVKLSRRALIDHDEMTLLAQMPGLRSIIDRAMEPHSAQH